MENTPWENALKTGRASITAYWYESKPFVFRDAQGQMTGIEYDILNDFARFLKDQYNVEATIQWKEASSFSDTYFKAKNRDPGLTFAVSAFSITDQRQQEVDFSPPYMSDISVLITSDNIPILTRVEEFHRLLPKLKAVTIEQTTYEHELLRWKHEANLPINISYIPSRDNIMQTISKTDSAFGFIDLPVYMMLFNQNPSIKINRQNLFAIKREGYAIVVPRHNDWNKPLSAFFSSEKFKPALEKIIGRYIDIDLYHLVERLAVQSDDQMVRLLTKEKEIQYKNMMGMTNQILKEARWRNFLVVLTSVVLASLVAIIALYRKKNEQKEELDEQRKSIALKSEQLETRNQHLQALDEEKNNLIKILAHDLRTPINHIQGLAQLVLMENKTLPEEQRMMINQITDSSVRLNKMITHLLDVDALENNRVQVFRDHVNLNPLLRKVVQSFEKSAQKKNITLEFSSPSEETWVMGDGLFLIEIFENLISNALKFSNAGTRIDVSVEQDGEFVRAHVQDQGPGMSDEDQQKLFKKFQRLSARPTAGEGSFGLGLSIVKQYVEMMEGKVWCTSKINEGARFTVELKVPDPA